MQIFENTWWLIFLTRFWDIEEYCVNDEGIIMKNIILVIWLISLLLLGDSLSYRNIPLLWNIGIFLCVPLISLFLLIEHHLIVSFLFFKLLCPGILYNMMIEYDMISSHFNKCHYSILFNITLVLWKSEINSCSIVV